MWYEMAPGYHYYTVTALMHYHQAEHDAGCIGVGLDHVHAMLRAPLHLVLPNKQLPTINDGGGHCSLDNRGPLYEWAAGLWPEMQETLEQYLGMHPARSSREALLYGPTEVTPRSPKTTELRFLDGLWVMRTPSMTTLLKASANAGGHDHYERLSLNCYLGGTELSMADPGNPGYGSPVHMGFFKRTVAHNTILVDNEDQAVCDANIGRSINTYPHKPFMSCTNSMDDAYPNCHVRRIVVQGDGWCFDWVHARSTPRYTTLPPALSRQWQLVGGPTNRSSTK